MFQIYGDRHDKQRMQHMQTVPLALLLCRPHI